MARGLGLLLFTFIHSTLLCTSPLVPKSKFCGITGMVLLVTLLWYPAVGPSSLANWMLQLAGRRNRHGPVQGQGSRYALSICEFRRRAGAVREKNSTTSIAGASDLGLPDTVVANYGAKATSLVRYRGPGKRRAMCLPARVRSTIVLHSTSNLATGLEHRQGTTV